jgi:hypothetical protein
MEPKPNQKYKHFKGGIYEIVCLEQYFENSENKLVVYKNIDDGKIWVREVNDFIGEKVFENGKKGRRFVKIK